MAGRSISNKREMMSQAFPNGWCNGQPGYKKVKMEGDQERETERPHHRLPANPGLHVPFRNRPSPLRQQFPMRSRVSVVMKDSEKYAAPPYCDPHWRNSHGGHGGRIRVVAVPGGSPHSQPSWQPDPSMAELSLLKSKADKESEAQRKHRESQQRADERERARLRSEQGISRFIQGPLVTAVKAEMPPARTTGRIPLQHLPIKFSKKRRSESPSSVQLPEEIFNASLSSGSSSPGSSATTAETAGTDFTLLDGEPNFAPSTDLEPMNTHIPVKIEHVLEEFNPLGMDDMHLVTEEDRSVFIRPQIVAKREDSDPQICSKEATPEPRTETATASILQNPDLPPFRPAIPLRAYPPIWAQTRQEVCETFEWFRSYQGGVYFSNDIVRGYLLSAFGAKRDVFKHDGRLIISHGGGCAESLHSENGHYTRRPAEDQQSDDKSVRALLKTYRERRPIALVIDDRYVLFPYDLSYKGVMYAVLGFYMIVHAWAEFEPDITGDRKVVKYKFAFQWCEGQGEPWWISESGKADTIAFDEEAPPVSISEESNMREESPIDAVSMKCAHCSEGSPQVYAQGWACLRPSCPRFWKLRQINETQPVAYLPENLIYQEDFLRLQAPCPLPIGFETLRPPAVKQRKDGVTTSHAFTRGFHCSKCGRMSCRVEWQKWRCSTTGCDTVHIVKGKIRAAKEFWSQSISSKFLTAEIQDISGVKRLPSRPFFNGSGNLAGLVDTFVLPHERGFLHHIQPASPFSRTEADEIFKRYQEQANDGQLVFKRWPMRSHKCRGALLTNYFSHNAGEPYHYVGGTDNTVPFDEAPSAVVQARALIQSQIFLALKGRKVEFNEVLSAAYMEKQKMAFHSDEEVGLGPFVAGLSLGSPAFMHFRLQRKHDKDRQQKGILMSFILRHGDVFVMDGLAVQKFYDHTVVPTNFRIAATARSINALPDPLEDPTLLTLPSTSSQTL